MVTKAILKHNCIPVVVFQWKSSSMKTSVPSGSITFKHCIYDDFHIIIIGLQNTGGNTYNGLDPFDVRDVRFVCDCNLIRMTIYEPI